MSNNAPVPYTAADVVVPAGFDESIDLLIQTYAKDLTPQEFSMAIASAHQRGLSITRKQIYYWKQGGKVIEVIGIDGFRSQAESHPDYAGQDGPYWCGDDGKWTDVWLSSDLPVAARVGIFRKGFTQPIYEVALMREYKKTTDTWKQYPTVMLAKVSEARAIRKAFPEKLGGAYAPEEIDRSNAIETTGRVVGERERPQQMRSTATVSPAPSNQERDDAKKSLWHIAHGTYGWDQATLNSVALDWADKPLTDLDAEQLRNLNMLLVTESPEDRQVRVDRATGVVDVQSA